MKNKKEERKPKLVITEIMTEIDLTGDEKPKTIVKIEKE